MTSSGEQQYRQSEAQAGMVQVQPVAWWRVIAAGVAILVIGVSLLYSFSLVARALALFFLALTLAAALIPVVNFLKRWMPRTLAVMLVYLIILAVFLLLGWLVVPPMLDQLRSFAGRLPELLNQAQSLLDRWDNRSNFSIIDTVTSQLSSLGENVLSLPLAITSSMVDLVLVLFLSLYFLLELPRMSKFIDTLFPKDQEHEIVRVLRAMGNAMGGYVRGSVIDAVIIGVITYVGLLIIGLDFPLVLGIIAAILELIPVVGPIILSVVATSVGFLQSPTQGLIVFVFTVILQQVENQILVPNIMRTQTEISPLLVLLALFTGASIGGLLGALVSIPLVAAVVVFVKMVVAPAVRRKTGAAEEQA